ncbi:hypothetical protein BGZ94_004607 [Podila epigama]|nr:hypothetical protein BGZ94_004607 [Podila epigama]
MAPEILNSVTRPGPSDNVHRVHAVIEGFVRHPYYNAPYPGMIPSKDDSSKVVEGMLVYGHSPIQVARLDQFEGDEYTRELLPVKILEDVPDLFAHGPSLKAGSVVEANVYVFTGPVEDLDQTREWDFEAFKNEHMEIWMRTGSEFDRGSYM